MSLFLVFFFAGIPFWFFAYLGDPLTPWFVWIISGTTLAVYSILRQSDKSESTLLNRASLGNLIIVKSGVMLLTAIIGLKTWPYQMTAATLICSLLLLEGYRASKNWKLFIPVRKQS